jgi:hypothetical protein
LHLRAIRDADAVIAIGGSSGGTHTAIYSAELLSKPTILIPTFGGTASDNWGYFRGRYYKDDEAEKLLQTWTDHFDDKAKSIAGSIASIAARQTRAAESPTERIGLAALAILSLALWIYVMFAMPPYISPAVALCILLASASVGGSTLRLILRRVGALSTEWAESQAMMSVVLGLLIGFGLLLVGGFANFSLNGKMMTIDTYDDARRIGISLSPVLFAVALFLEQAWARLAQKGIYRLKSS